MSDQLFEPPAAADQVTLHGTSADIQHLCNIFQFHVLIIFQEYHLRFCKRKVQHLSHEVFFLINADGLIFRVVVRVSLLGSRGGFIVAELRLVFGVLFLHVKTDAEADLIQPGDKQLRIFQTMDVLQDENVCFLQGVLGQIFIFQIMIGKMVQPLMCR